MFVLMIPEVRRRCTDGVEERKQDAACKSKCVFSFRALQAGNKRMEKGLDGVCRCKIGMHRRFIRN